MDRGELEALDRESLVRRAEAAGVRRARILTRPELVDELLRRDPAADQAQLQKKRGFFGRARDLVARVVERGLHLPDAADRIRSLGTLPPSVPRTEPQAVPTVTLAEIYAAQGHKHRAIDTVRRVLEREPDHAAARALLARLEDAAYVPPPPPLPPEAEIEPSAAEHEAADDATSGPPGDASVATGDARARTEEQAPPPADVAAPEVVAIPHGRGATFVQWRVPRRLHAAGGLAVRVLIVTPSWEGPSKAVRDVPLDGAAGEIVVRDLPDRAVVRVALGVVEGDRFAAIARSPALELSPLSPGARLAGGLSVWSLQGLAPVVLDDPRASAIARALESARRLPA